MDLVESQGINAEDVIVRNLLKKCKLGAHQAWEELVRKYQGRVFGMAFQYLGNHEDASEITQDVFLKVYQQIKQFEGDHFLAWILFITRNMAIDRLRWKKIRHATTQITQEEPDFVDPNPTPEQAMVTRSKQSLLYKALKKLTPEKREMVMMKEIQGLKFSEIASMLGLPVGTVKSRSNQARMELAKAVVEINPDYAKSK